MHPSGIVSLLFVAAPAKTEPSDSMTDTIRRYIFTNGNDPIWRCTAGETDEFECKESFNLKGIGKTLKTIAGYANHSGGDLFFGVKDKPDGFVGCGLTDRFNDTDQNKFSQTIRDA
jgi:hypothetical protein